PNSLQWTPGGELPVVFAFETGHTTSPYPNNNSYGGCSSGPPPPTPGDPAVPCPSYDPGSWTNDTVTPWEIGPPTFFNATERATPSQVSFTQDFGGIAFIDPLSNYSCSGRDGSAFCSYPWYSFSCAEHAFEFGATDYPTTTDDFGGYNEYSSSSTTDSAALGYFPPTNFSIPTCGGTSYNVTVGPSAGGGVGYFLSTPVGSPTPFAPVAPGEYSISAIPGRGEWFSSWSTTGGVTVAAIGDPSTTLRVTGNGSVTPSFSSSAPPTTTLTVYTSLSGGHIVVLNSSFYTTGLPLATLANGGSLALVPGTYSIQAEAPVGYNFTSWSVSGGGAQVASPAFPYTWLDVPSSGSAVTLTARSTASSSFDTLYYSVYFGSGTISFDGGLATSYGTSTVKVGTYAIQADPAPGWAVSGWYAGSSAVMTDFAASSNVTLEDGASYVYAEFSPLVHVRSSPASGGGISVSAGPATPSSDQYLYPGYYSLIAAPSAGYALSGWSVSSSANLWVYATAGGGDTLVVNASGTITARFSAQSAVNLTFASSPSVGGVRFNFVSYLPGSENSTLATGTYRVAELPAPGYNLSGWKTTGAVSVSSSGFATVTGSGGTVEALYSRASYPVTVTISPPVGASVTIHPPVGANRTLATGETIWMSGTQEQASVDLPAGLTLLGWTGSPGLIVFGSAPATVAVNGPGTLAAFFGGFTLSARLAPGVPIDLGKSFTATATAVGSGTFVYTWSGLPPGCLAAGRPSFSCTPNAAGSYSVSVQVNASDGTNHSVVAGTITIVPTLALTAFAPSPANFTLGQSTELMVRTYGGVAPLSYQYSGLPASCPSLDQPTLACTPTSAGRIAVAVRVVDASGLPVGGSSQFTINPLPMLVQFNASRAVTDVGVPVDWSIWATGGTPPLTYAYAGLPGGCLSQNSAQLQCTPTVAGLFTVNVTATDQDGIAVGTEEVLTVHPALQLGSISLPWPGVAVNSTAWISVAATGGTVPLSYVYHGLPSGCSSRDVANLTCTPSATGNFTVRITVADALGVSVNTSVVFSVTPEVPSGPGPTPGGSSSSPFPTLGFLLVVAAVAVAIVAVVVWSRRRPPSAAETREDAADPPSPFEEPPIESPR
ncbi:MAG: hypothetical protein L3J91_00345, partial [Thermoplasmata archaeon]|nr:hypothetical protein [Thermoplasmata archaeon]